MTDSGRPSHRHRRELHVADTTAEEVLVYSLYRGDELLMTRSGTAEVIDKIRSAMEPLPPGLRATLGTGTARDPIVAEGGASPATPEERLANAALFQAERIAALTMKMARENLQVLEFSRTVVADLTRDVAVAREEARQLEEARWKTLLGQVQSEQARPLLSSDAMAQLAGLLQNLLSQTRGAKNG